MLAGRAKAACGAGNRALPVRGRLRYYGGNTKTGGLGGTRTLDQCLKRALLYQLSYQPDEDVGK